MIVKVHIDSADVEVIDRARGRRSRSEYVGSAAIDRATRDIINAPSMPAPRVERSCFTCDWASGNECHHRSDDEALDLAIEVYIGAVCDDNGMPTNRSIDCPGWAPKEQG